MGVQLLLIFFGYIEIGKARIVPPLKEYISINN